MEPHDNNTVELPESYEVPEVVELGEAALLTLGAYGCADDGGECKHNTDPVFDF
jgi:hypothetical protein